MIRNFLSCLFCGKARKRYFGNFVFMNTSYSLLHNICELAKPFTKCQYVPDWQYRALRLSMISDYYRIKISENPWFQEESYSISKNFLSLSPIKSALQSSFSKEISIESTIKYSIDYGLLSDGEFQIYNEMFEDVDFSEKVVISACAYAICNLSSPIELTLDLCNLLYEEALHLEAISTMLGLEQSNREWISVDKKTNWDLVLGTDNIISYLLIEHCLYEGRGFLASVKAVSDLEKYDTESVIYQISSGILRQELNHVLLGYKWLKQLDNGKIDKSIKDAVKIFLENELIDDISNFRGRKHRFPLLLISKYLKDRNYYEMQKIIFENSKHWLKTGHLLVSDQDLVNSVTYLEEWCLS